MYLFLPFFCFVFQNFSIFTLNKGEEIKCENCDFLRFSPVFSPFTKCSNLRLAVKNFVVIVVFLKMYISMMRKPPSFALFDFFLPFFLHLPDYRHFPASRNGRLILKTVSEWSLNAILLCKISCVSLK